MLIGATALLLGGGGLAVYATTALAGNNTPDAAAGHSQHTASAFTLSCPDVGERLRQVPRSAKLPVSKGLSSLDKQVHDAYHKMMGGTGDSVLTGLKTQRAKTIRMMVTAISKDAKKPSYLLKMSGCTMKPVSEGAGTGGNDSTKSVQDGWYQGQTQNQTQGQTQGQSQDPGQVQGQVGGRAQTAASRTRTAASSRASRASRAARPPTTSSTSTTSSRTRTPRRSPPPRAATPRPAPSSPSAAAMRTATSTPTTSS